MRLLLITFFLIGLIIMAVPQPARAYNLFSGVDCGQANGSTVCTEKGKTGNPISGTDGLLLKITNIIAYAAGAAAVILLIIGAIRYVLSGSDVSVGNRIDDDVLNAKRTIANALIGIVIIVLAKLIITFVITKLH
jgi:amino acid transporter